MNESGSMISNLIVMSRILRKTEIRAVIKVTKYHRFVNSQQISQLCNLVLLKCIENPLTVYSGIEYQHLDSETPIKCTSMTSSTGRIQPKGTELVISLDWKSDLHFVIATIESSNVNRDVECFI